MVRGVGGGGQLSVAELDLMERSHAGHAGLAHPAFPDPPSLRHPGPAPARPGRAGPGGPAGEERVGDFEAIAALAGVVARLPLG
jgi:hypothetical protein